MSRTIRSASAAVAVLAASLSVVSAQTYQRLGTCPDLGCVLPPDQVEFLAGQYFDLRVEVHAPKNGSEAFNDGKPDTEFSVTIEKAGGDGAKGVAEFFAVDEPELEEWTFGWYEDLFAEDEEKESIVNVASKIYRRIALYEPGDYTVTLSYYDDKKTTASWTVRPLKTEKKAKNVIFFIGDGMTTNMITAARLLAHESVNGKYKTLMQMDKFPVLGHQMTHSIDSFITDSANSASALYSGHKSTVNAMGVYVDSSPDEFDDPKVETIVELLVRYFVCANPHTNSCDVFRRDSVWGAVTTAYLADATPTALTAHTRQRGNYGPLVDQALNGLTNYTWTDHKGPTVYFGGGAEQFYAGEESYQGKDYYAEFANKGYGVAQNKTALLDLPNDKRGLGIFCQSNLPVWLDRNVYTDVLSTFENSPAGGEEAATDLPGLREMTIKAVEMLHEQGGDKGFFLMVEAASIDKQMHSLDYDRALGDLLELDDTIKATIATLEELGVKDDTLVVVSADHGHGFDVFGSADTKYIKETEDERTKRYGVGTYENSGLSQYTSPAEGKQRVSYGEGAVFPQNWSPRYALAAGVAASPDRREDYAVRQDKPRNPAVKPEGGKEYFVNPKDSPKGFVVNGTLAPDASTGVHSLTDVPVFAMGPCQDDFGGVYNNVDVFFKIAECLGLGQGADGAEGPVAMG